MKRRNKKNSKLYDWIEEKMVLRQILEISQVRLLQNNLFKVPRRIIEVNYPEEYLKSFLPVFHARNVPVLLFLLPLLVNQQIRGLP